MYINYFQKYIKAIILKPRIGKDTDIKILANFLYLSKYIFIKYTDFKLVKAYLIIR